MRLYKKILKLLLSVRKPSSLAAVVTEQRERAQRVKLLLPMIYGLSMINGVHIVRSFFYKWNSSEELLPIWSVQWVSHELAGMIGLLCSVLFYLSGALCLWRSQWWSRLIHALAFFLLASLSYSFGKIDHGNHSLLWVLVFLVFLPDLSPSRLSLHFKTLSCFFMAQIFAVFVYTFSGLWKVVYSFVQGIKGEVHSFHPNAFATQIAQKQIELGHETLLGPFFLAYPVLGWPLYTSVVLFELFTIFLVLRGYLHWYLGLGLLLFHIGSAFSINIFFQTNALLVLILFLMSPFGLRTGRNTLP